MTKIYSLEILKKNRSLLVLLSMLLIVGTIFLNTPAVKADDTTNYPWIRPVDWASQVIKSPTGGTGTGHIGVDILLGSKDRTYTPCHNTSDTFIAGCQNSGGYYKVQKYSSSSNDFPFGIFIDNSNGGANHFWARRLGTVFLEIYPYSVPVNSALSGYRLDPGACNCTVFGGLEVVINDWKGGAAAGSAYSANIGTLRATSLSEPDVAKLNGFVRRNSATVSQNEVNFDWFGQDSSSSRSSANFPVYSFASWPTNTDGYYTSGPLLKGNYHIFVTDNGPNQQGPSRKVECLGIVVKNLTDRMDLQLTQQHFGLDGPGRQCYDR